MASACAPLLLRPWLPLPSPSPSVTSVFYFFLIFLSFSSFSFVLHPIHCASRFFSAIFSLRSCPHRKADIIGVSSHSTCEVAAAAPVERLARCAGAILRHGCAPGPAPPPPMPQTRAKERIVPFARISILPGHAARTKHPAGASWPVGGGGPPWRRRACTCCVRASCPRYQQPSAVCAA